MVEPRGPRFLPTSVRSTAKRLTGGGDPILDWIGFVAQRVRSLRLPGSFAAFCDGLSVGRLQTRQRDCTQVPSGAQPDLQPPERFWPALFVNVDR